MGRGFAICLSNCVLSALSLYSLRLTKECLWFWLAPGFLVLISAAICAFLLQTRPWLAPISSLSAVFAVSVFIKSTPPPADADPIGIPFVLPILVFLNVCALVCAAGRAIGLKVRKERDGRLCNFT